MGTTPLEHQVGVLAERIEELEQKVGLRKRHNLWAQLSDPWRHSSWLEVSRALGWCIVTVSLLAICEAWLNGQSFSLLLGLWLLLGTWLAMRHSSVFGISDSTLSLLQEGRSSRRFSAHHAHQVINRMIHRKSAEQVQQERLRIAGSMLGTFMLVSLASWGIFSYVPTTAGQAFILLLAVLAGLTHAVRQGSRTVAVLCLVAAYGVLTLSLAPVFAIFAMLLLSAVVGRYAWQRSDFKLLLIVVTATYASLLRWTLHGLDTQVAEQYKEGMIAEIVLVCSLLIGLPIAYRRRIAAEREAIRAIVSINAAALAGLSALLAIALNPSDWPFSLAVIGLLSVALTAIAWQHYGRNSYAKYFLLAHGASFLVIVNLTFRPSLASLIWLVASGVVMAAGFKLKSYTFRLAGLFLLGASVVQYLFFSLPSDGLGAGVFHDSLWVGLLLACFLAMTGLWFRDLSTRGPEQRLRPAIVLGLYSASAVIVFLIVVSELSHYS